MASSYSSDESTEISRVRYRRDSYPARRVPPPPPHGGPHYIQTVTREARDRPPVGYFQHPGPRLPEERMTVVHHTHRSRSRDRRSPPVHMGLPARPPPANPQVVINQNPVVERRYIHSDSSSDESSHGSSHHHRRRRGRRSHSRAHRSRSSSTHSYLEDAREKWRLQNLEEQLNAMRLDRAKAEEQQQLAKYQDTAQQLALTRAELESRERRDEDALRHNWYKDEAALDFYKRENSRLKHRELEKAREREHEEHTKLVQNSDELARLKKQQEERLREQHAAEEAEYKKSKAELERRIKAEEESKREKAREEGEKARAALAELERIHAAKKQKEEEERIRRELELKKLEEEKKAAEEKKRKEKERDEYIAEFKAKEAERIAKEKEAEEAAKKEFQRVLQEKMLKSGFDDKAIEAVMKGEKVKKEETQVARPTYTRLSLRHYDIESLVYYNIEYEPDPDPGYVIVRRWVTEEEQRKLYEHTQMLRIRVDNGHRHRRDHKVMLEVDTRQPRRHRSNSDFEFVRKRSRSKSPGGLLMYLAGARPR